MHTNLVNFLRTQLIGNPSAYIKTVQRVDKKTNKRYWSWVTEYKRITKEMLQKHIDKKLSIGAFPISYKWKTLYCSFIAIDVDFHIEVEKDGVKYDSVDENLKQKSKEVIEYLYMNTEKYFGLKQDNIFVEDSGGGYHIWIPLKENTTLINASLYINYIRPIIQQHFIGIDDDLEFFPKQFAEDMKLGDGTINLSKKPGNAIRLPFGYNHKRKAASRVIFGNILSFKPADIMPMTKKLKVTISQIKTKKMNKSIPETSLDTLDRREVVIEEGIKYFYEHPDFRLCFKYCIDNRHKLKGSNGNIMRVGLSNELYSLGAKKTTIAQAFSNQKDFDYDKAMRKIDDCIKYVNYYNNPLTLRCKTIQKLGFCVESCPKLGGTNNKNKKLIKKLPSVKGWSGLYDLIDTVIHEKNKRYYIYKTTRSGTTTAVIIKSLQQRKKILMIAPLINIFKITVNDAIEIGKDLGFLDGEYKVHRVKSNFEVCGKIKTHFRDVTDIEFVFPFFYKGYCKKCKDKEECEFQDFIENLENNDLIYLTVRKFNAMINGGEDNALLLRRLLNWSDVVFVDECSHIFDVEWDSKVIWTDDKGKITNKLNDWDNALTNFVMEYPAWNQTDQIICLNDFIKDLKKKVNEIKYFNQSYFESIKNQYYERLSMRKQIEFYLQLLEYFKTSRNYDVKHLIDCFLNMTRKEIYFQLLMPLKEPKKIILASVSNIRNLVEYLNHYTKTKLLFLTDATEPPIDLNKCFDDLNYLYVNDPNNTAIKQKILVVNGMYDFFRFSNGLKDEILDVLDQFASKKIHPVFLVTQSKRVLGFVLGFLRNREYKLEKDWQIKMTDYFRGKHTKGQPSPYRQMIVLGTPKPPTHCYDFVADIYRKAGYLEEYKNSEVAGKYLENYSAQSSFFQAISRVKCPKGVEPSLVVVYGCKKREINNWLDMKINTPEVL